MLQKIFAKYYQVMSIICSTIFQLVTEIFIYFEIFYFSVQHLYVYIYGLQGLVLGTYEHFVAP